MQNAQSCIPIRFKGEGKGKRKWKLGLCIRVSKNLGFLFGVPYHKDGPLSMETPILSQQPQYASIAMEVIKLSQHQPKAPTLQGVGGIRNFCCPSKSVLAAAEGSDNPGFQSQLWKGKGNVDRHTWEKLQAVCRMTAAAMLGP